tara:strand:+ start:1118 stop:1273 length:156 start_codon:yes stop_codon:yes gene_type:complete
MIAEGWLAVSKCRDVSGKDPTLVRRTVIALVDAANGPGGTLPRADFLNSLA